MLPNISESRFVLCSDIEAVSVKLFSNVYLAMRVCFFNELDSFCHNVNADTNSVIKGICLDNRIGDFYNKPSLGYAGHCFPKDVKQLIHSAPHDSRTLNAINQSNNHRAQSIIELVLTYKPTTVGIYSDNPLNSRSFDISALRHIFEGLLKHSVSINLCNIKLKPEDLSAPNIKLVNIDLLIQNLM